MASVSKDYILYSKLSLAMRDLFSQGFEINSGGRVDMWVQKCGKGYDITARIEPCEHDISKGAVRVSILVNNPVEQRVS